MHIKTYDCTGLFLCVSLHLERSLPLLVKIGRDFVSVITARYARAITLYFPPALIRKGNKERKITAG